MVAEDMLQPISEREQTDESLRAEREKVDAIDETAGALIEKARERAEKILATARAKVAHRSDPAAARLSGKLASAHDEEVLREARSQADEVVRAERDRQSGVQLSELRRDTDENLHEERWRSDEALATRDEFLGIVSHDLRNMLGSVMGFAALIERAASRENPADTVRMCAQRIQRSGARMSRLIGDLVDVASIEAGVLAVTRELGDPAQVLMEAVDTFQAPAAAANITLVAEVITPLLPIPFDPARLLQVLTNLLSNAIKFTPPKGRVVVRVERLGDEIQFGVSDNGVGIAADKLEAIFERFQQLVPNDRRGLGLGLYISKSIVQGHGGRIWAKSKPGEGSTFYFTLPIPSEG